MILSNLEILVNYRMVSAIDAHISNYARAYAISYNLKTKSVESACPFLDVSDSSLFENSDVSIKDFDVASISIMQDYASKLQLSRERRFFEQGFDATAADIKLEKSRKNVYHFANAIVFVGTVAGVYVAMNFWADPDSFIAAPILSTMSGASALYLESISNPMGKLFMKFYNKSRFIGTESYEKELSRRCVSKISRHLKRHNGSKSPLMNSVSYSIC